MCSSWLLGRMAFLKPLSEASWRDLRLTSGFWSWGCKGSEACYAPVEEEILVFMEEFELPQKQLAPKHSSFWHSQLPVLVWVFEGKPLPHIMPLLCGVSGCADFKNSLIDTWAREHGMKWVYHTPCHAPASGKIRWYNGLLKTLKGIAGELSNSGFYIKQRPSA